MVYNYNNEFEGDTTSTTLKNIPSEVWGWLKYEKIRQNYKGTLNDFVLEAIIIPKYREFKEIQKKEN